MKVESYLAFKHLLHRRKGTWAWVISLMTTGSVALGVAALVTTLSVMTGFREDIQTKILGVQPHVILFPWGRSLDPQDPALQTTLNHQKEVLVWSPYVNGQLLIGHESQNSGAIVKGIDTDQELKVVNVKDRLILGQWKDLEIHAHNSSIILGRELARTLGVTVGDQVWAIAPADLANSMTAIPKMRQFSVRGILQTGYYEWDTSLVYMGLPEAQKLFGLGSGVSAIGVKVNNIDKAEEVAKELQKTLQGKALATSWLAMNRNLFSALKTEKRMMFIILILVTIVASFMIVSNLLLTVTQRTREIGILKAMGADSRRIHKIFLIEGVLMGGIGTLTGLGLGLALSELIATTRLISLPADVYYIDKLPVKIAGPDLIMVALAAGTITLLAALYPAHRASRLDPLEAIRFG